MNLPDKLNRKRIKFHFHKLGDRTWDYLFDHEKENGLSTCRTPGFGTKTAWYSSDAVKLWLVARNYYGIDDFSNRQPAKRATPWSALEAVAVS